jgi:hypothetical protein
MSTTTQPDAAREDFWQREMVIVPVLGQLPKAYAQSCIWAATVPEEVWVIDARWHILFGQLLTLIHETQDKHVMAMEHYERLAGMIPWPPESEAD